MMLLDLGATKHGEHNITLKYCIYYIQYYIFPFLYCGRLVADCSCSPEKVEMTKRYEV